VPIPDGREVIYRSSSNDIKHGDNIVDSDFEALKENFRDWNNKVLAKIEAIAKRPELNHSHLLQTQKSWVDHIEQMVAMIKDYQSSGLPALKTLNDRIQKKLAEDENKTPQSSNDPVSSKLKETEILIARAELILFELELNKLQRQEILIEVLLLYTIVAAMAYCIPDQVIMEDEANLPQTASDISQRIAETLFESDGEEINIYALIGYKSLAIFIKLGGSINRYRFSKFAISPDNKVELMAANILQKELLRISGERRKYETLA
jgi:hypothetical protein